MIEDIIAIEGMKAGRGPPVYNGGNFQQLWINPPINFTNGLLTS